MPSIAELPSEYMIDLYRRISADPDLHPTIHVKHGLFVAGSLSVCFRVVAAYSSRRARARARNLCRLPTVAVNAVQPQWAWPGRSMRAMVRRVPSLVLQGNSLPWLLHGLRPPDAAAAAAAYTSKASSASGHRRLLCTRKSTLYHCL